MIKNYFFKDIGVMFGRSIRHILRSRDFMIIAAMIIIPIAFVLLFIFVLGSMIQALERNVSCNHQ